MDTVARAISALKDKQTLDIIRIHAVLERHDYVNALRERPCCTTLRWV